MNLAFMAPMHQALTINNQSFAFSIQQKFMPSAYSGSFTKLRHLRGPLVRRLNNQLGKGMFFVFAPFELPINDVLFNTIGGLITFLDNLAGSLFFLFTCRNKRSGFKSPGLCRYEPVKQALTLLLPYVQTISIIQGPPPMSNGILYKTIKDDVNPQKTITARLRGILPAQTFNGINVTDPITQGSEAPEFPEAMYRSLADRSTDYILPGLSKIPPNKVALLQTNQAFIESYMVGLNHEISREYLWREFPAPLNSTAFRQFWDVRDNQNALINPEDIQRY